MPTHRRDNVRRRAVARRTVPPLPCGCARAPPTRKYRPPGDNPPADPSVIPPSRCAPMLHTHPPARGAANAPSPSIAHCHCPRHTAAAVSISVSLSVSVSTSATPASAPSSSQRARCRGPPASSAPPSASRTRGTIPWNRWRTGRHVRSRSLPRPSAAIVWGASRISPALAGDTKGRWSERQPSSFWILHSAHSGV
jgi:hypothetical protein